MECSFSISFTALGRFAIEFVGIFFGITLGSYIVEKRKQKREGLPNAR